MEEINTKKYKFRICAKCIHLTYKSHIPGEELLEFIKKTIPLEPYWYSIVWENGHEPSKGCIEEKDIENPHELSRESSAPPLGTCRSSIGESTQNTTTKASNKSGHEIHGRGITKSIDERPYEHTHAVFGYRRRFDIRSERRFDFRGIHPFIQPINGKKHETNIWKYHEKEPIAIWRSSCGPNDEIPISMDEKRIKSASSLYDACKEFGIEIKSVADIKLIRDDRRRPERHVHQYHGHKWKLPLERNFKCLFVYGATGTGKTQWAIHCFASPLIVSHVDQLRDFDASIHDGIVFDDMSFHHMPREAIIHLTDWDIDRQIHCRYSCAKIPAETRKIFTANINFEQCFPEDPSGAIRRRFTKIIHVSGNTFSSNNEREEEESSEASIILGEDNEETKDGDAREQGKHSSKGEETPQTKSSKETFGGTSDGSVWGCRSTHAFDYTDERGRKQNRVLELYEFDDAVSRFFMF